MDKFLTPIDKGAGGIQKNTTLEYLKQKSLIELMEDFKKRFSNLGFF
jgi:hypothetical protein